MSSQSYIYNPQEDRIAATGAGFQIPRLTTTQRLATVVGPGDAGLTVFDTTVGGTFVWTGTAWVSSSGSGGEVLTVDNVAALKALVVAGVPDGQMITTRGYYTDGDGGQGTYLYDSTSVSTDNGGSVIAPTTGSGRYLLQFNGIVNVRQFGAKGDNVTDDATSLTSAIAVSANGTYPVYFPAGTYLTTSTLTFNGNFELYGDCQGVGVSVSFSGSGSVIRYAGLGTAIQVNDGTNKITQQFSIHNISVVGYASNLTTRTGAVGITFGISSGTLLSCQGSVRDVWISGFTTAGMLLVAAQGVAMYSTRTSDNEVGMSLDAQGGGANRNCIFYRCQFTNNGLGVSIKEGGGIGFSGCLFESNDREGMWISRQVAVGSYNLASIEMWDCHVEANQANPANDGQTYAAQVRNDTTLTTGAEGGFLNVWGGRWIPKPAELNSFGKLNRLFKVQGARLYAWLVRPNAFTYPIGAMVEESVGPTPTIVTYVCDYNPWIGAAPASQFPISAGTVLQWTLVGSASLTLYYETITTNSFWRATSSQMYAQYAFGAVGDMYSDIRIRNGSLFAGPVTSYPVASAIAAFRSTTQGVAFPQMTTAQKNAIVGPVAGLVVYDTTLNKICVYTTAWETVTSA